MSIEKLTVYRCDFCKKEIDVKNIKIFQAHKISKCRLIARSDNGKTDNDISIVEDWDICLDCAIKLYKDGLSLVNGIVPKNQKVEGLPE